MTVRRGFERDRGRPGGCTRYGTISVIKEDVKQSLAGGTESSGWDLSVQAAFVQLSQEAAMLVQTSRAESAWLRTTIGYNIR